MKLPVRIPQPGPILQYHAWLHAKDPAMAEYVHGELKAMLRTPGGSMLLEILEKSVQLLLTDILADERALAARNAQGFILTDLQRIASDEYEKILAAKDDAANARRGIARRQSGS